MPSVWLIVFDVTVMFRTGVSVFTTTTPVPAPMPCEPTVLLATIVLLLTTAVVSALPNDEIAMAVPRVLDTALPVMVKNAEACAVGRWFKTAEVSRNVAMRFTALAPDTPLFVMAIGFAAEP